MSKEKKEEKSHSIFDFINFLTIDKKKWEELSEEDQKAFQPFMMNKFLSLNLMLTEMVNEIQQITTSKAETWRLYYEILPTQKIYLKYIKSKDEANEKKMELIRKYFNCNYEMSVEYFNLLSKTDEGKKEIENIEYTLTGNDNITIKKKKK